MLCPKCKNAKSTLSAHDFSDDFKELASLSVNNQDDVTDSEAHTFDNTYVPDNVDELDDVITVDRSQQMCLSTTIKINSGCVCITCI